MFIYKITNIINNKCYIGQTVNVNKRFNQHIFWSSRKNTPLYSSMQKYGKSNFTIEILENCSNQDELDFLERYYIKFYNSNNLNFGYNIEEGGKRNRKAPKHVVAALKIANSKKIISEETRLKMRNAQLGKTTSDYQKQRVAESNKNRVHSAETRNKLSVGRLGKKHTEETKRKISQTKKANNINE